ncbi:hypothetical protein V8F06_007233 [Rhypophila decipiens]
MYIMDQESLPPRSELLEQSVYTIAGCMDTPSRCAAQRVGCSASGERRQTMSYQGKDQEQFETLATLQKLHHDVGKLKIGESDITVIKSAQKSRDWLRANKRSKGLRDIYEASGSFLINLFHVSVAKEHRETGHSEARLPAFDIECGRHSEVWFARSWVLSLLWHWSCRRIGEELIQPSRGFSVVPSKEEEEGGTGEHHRQDLDIVLR